MVLNGCFCCLELLDVDCYVVDLFVVYVFGDNSDWMWLVFMWLESVVVIVYWIVGKVNDDVLVLYVVVDLCSEQVVGIVSYMVIEWEMGMVEIGYVIWL